VEETGFGRQLATCDFEDGELLGAVDALLAAGVLHERLAVISARMKAADGTTRAADLIERVGITQAPVMRP
jgi:UDP:flavonoid glycosyltransferase YjiC (YdhE family)